MSDKTSREAAEKLAEARTTVATTGDYLQALAAALEDAEAELARARTTIAQAVTDTERPPVRLHHEPFRGERVA